MNAGNAARAERQAARRQGGQVLVLFALSLFVLTGMVAVVVDVSWFWSNGLRVQRAADAAALAGAVYLPGNITLAYDTARAEATKNGYTDSAGGVTVTPRQDAQNVRRLIVTISAPVPTFFARVFGLHEIIVIQSARAEYALPVPMGSPLNYLGAYVFRTPASSTSGDTGLRVPGNAPSGSWSYTGSSMTSSVQTNDTTVAQAQSNGTLQQWSNFSFTGGNPPRIPVPASDQTLIITGIEVVLTGANVSASCAGSAISVALSWNAGTSWSSTATTGALTTSNQTFTLGSPDTTAAWGSRTWVRSNFTNTNFRVRLTAVKGCSTSSTWVRLNQLQIRVSWQLDKQEDLVGQPLTSSNGSTALASQGFWLTAVSQGASKINGDAYLPRYDPRKSGLNAEYAPDLYYNYIVELAPNSQNVAVYVFDAPFCATAGSGLYGTGSRWLSSTQSAISTFYRLYDTNGTLADLSDDTLIASSGNLFRNVQASDTDLGGPTPTGSTLECRAGITSDPNDPRYWHNRWWPVATGLSAGSAGRLLRLHVTTTDFASPNDQNDANGHNSFAIEARVTSGSSGAPKVYGLEALEAAFMLPGGAASEFYLAQIEGMHAGKTMLIELYDPGDTGSLRAEVEILMPTATGYTPAAFSYTARRAASNASSCDSNSGTNVTSVVTNNGGTSFFDGCWLSISVPLPTTYTAPTPPGVPGPGWWKIRYTMSGSTSTVSTDGATWRVSIRGSPVHLQP